MPVIGRINIMTILTITFHKAINYGAVLQCYALQNVLKQYADEVKTIDFCTSSMTYKIIPKQKGVKGFLKNILLLNKYGLLKKKHYNFDCFVKNYIELTNHYNNIEDLNQNPPEADIVFTGSDQVFNLNRKQDERRAFYLDFPCKYKASYAASFGNSGIPNDEKLIEIKRYLSSFNAISIRESYSIPFVEKITGRSDVQQVLDPVFLIETEVWQRMEQPYENLPKRFILLFFLRESQKAIDITKKIRRKLKLPVVIITNRPVVELIHCYEIYDCSPQQFIWLIDHCAFFVNDSFHGTAFSIILKKQFLFCDDHEKSYERGRALLDHFSLSQCYDFNSWEDLVSNRIDYCETFQILKHDKLISLQYIANCIKDCKV